MSATWEAINEVLGDIPDLGGAEAKCVGKAPLFDVEDPDDERAEAARNICGSCAAKPDCSNWFASLPKGNRRPAGTIAGRTYERPVLAAPRLAADLHEDQGADLRDTKSTTNPPPKPRLDAAQWLAGRLADGPVLAADVIADGIRDGLSASALDRARRAIGAVSQRLPGRRGASEWSLDAHCSPRSSAVAAEGVPA